MARNEWVRDKLINWANWLVERQSGSRGYPKQTTFARLAGDRMSTESVVPTDDLDASNTNAAMGVLRAAAPHLWLALMCRYIGDPRVRAGKRRPLHQGEIAKALCVSESTVKRHLADAEGQVGIILNRQSTPRRCELPSALLQ